MRCKHCGHAIDVVHTTLTAGSSRTKGWLWYAPTERGLVCGARIRQGGQGEAPRHEVDLSERVVRAMLS